MSRTDQQRFDEAIEYLKQIKPLLAADVKRKIGAKALEAGKEISLEGHGYALVGSQGQHMAVRALLLCQTAYLTEVYSGAAHVDTKKYFHYKLESTVRDAIGGYLRNAHATSKDLADAAERVKVLSPPCSLYTLARDNNLDLGNSPICYNAVKMWLFKVGFVSLRWLARNDVFNMSAYTANAILGDGTVRDEAEMWQIPAGHIFNFHQPANKWVCHWGVVIGHGDAIATNTQAAWLGAKVVFKAGGSEYGKFRLRDAYDVCKSKYAPDKVHINPITIRDIDPANVPNRC